ncbi:MAG: DUF6492 family protein [Cyanobacteria bacterium P01_A01_bin.105]
MTQAVFDIVIPLFRVRWNTRATLEGLTQHYQPRSIHIITPGEQADVLAAVSADWATAPLHLHPEEVFFKPVGFTKDRICEELDLGESLYTPGWFFQQLLKLGAYEGIEGLSEWYLVWDSDLLPGETWPALAEENGEIKHRFALIQHNAYGNPAIVAKWEHWINTVLGIPAVKDPVGTFIPHHMWFKQSHLRSFAQRIGEYYESTDHWLLLMMRSANDFETFGEYWCYSSWVAHQAPEDLSFYPYEIYGETSERFFDDGTGLFSAALGRYQGAEAIATDPFYPPYKMVDAFIREEYGLDALPSSIAFESSPRHLKKNEATMHIEETRSRWNPRMAATA